MCFFYTIILKPSEDFQTNKPALEQSLDEKHVRELQLSDRQAQIDSQMSEEVEKRLKTKEDVWDTFGALVPLPACVVELENQKILFYNQQFFNLLEIPQTGVGERRFQEFCVEPEACDRIKAHLQNGDRLEHYELRLKKQNGEVCGVLLFAKPTVYRGQPAAFAILTEINQEEHSSSLPHPQLAAVVEQAEDAIEITDNERQQFVALVENSPNFVAMSSPEGSILYLNESGGQLVGLERPDLALGQDIGDYLPKEAQTQLVLPTQERGTGEGQLQHCKTGQSIDVHWSYFPVRHKQSGDLLCFATIQRDITAQKQAERELRIRARQQAAVAQLGQQALAGNDLTTLMNEAAILVAQTLDVKYSKVLELLPNGEVFLLRAGVGWQAGLVGYALIGAQIHSQVGYTLQTQEPAIVEDFRIETRFSGPPLLHNHGCVSGISVIIPGQQQPFGVLGAYAKTQRAFTEDDIHFLQAIANVLATAIERKQAEARLNLMERAIASSSNGIAITDSDRPDNPLIYVNPAFETITGYTAGEAIGRNCRFLQGADTDRAAVGKLRTAIQEQRECRVVLKNYRKDGTPFWNELNISPVFDGEGYLTNFVGIQTDITERKRAEVALRESKERLNGILSSLDDVVWSMTPYTFTLLYLNPAAEKVYGRPVCDFLRDPNLWFEAIHPEDRERVRNEMDALMETKSLDTEYRIVRPDGTIRWLYARRHLIYQEDGTVLRIDGISTDVTERRRMEEKLLHDAFHDALIGLPNRASFIGKLDAAIRRTKQGEDYSFAVLFLDLDRFKVINDSLGHMVGDRLLVAIARRLETCLRPGDCLARLGGDEFTILLDTIQNVSEATDVAECIHQALEFPFNLNGYEIFTSASIGIALSATGYDRPEEILRDADTAMYRAKEQGRAGHAVFDVAMYDSAVALLQLETDLRWAIEREELRVYYQPIVSLGTGAIVGFEALVRWQHPEQGTISPDQFIPIAEETGLIIPLGMWVLRESCRQLHRWQQQFPRHSPLTMSVNLSGKQFSQPDLIEQIAKILQETQIVPGSLKLEITESGIMENTEAAGLLEQLKALNIKLSIDDFGTGYSSLSRLNQFPIHTLKIDRSFVNKIQEEGENGTIVQAIVTLAHSLGMDVIAEGVETTQQLSQLKGLHCEYGQGYFFAKPLPGEEVQHLIAIAPSP